LQPALAIDCPSSYGGTHEGGPFELAPTGRRVTYAGAAFCFDEQARIASAWVLGDLVTLFSQLGLKDISRIPGK
jgi:predicted ester cyclase